MNGRPRPWSAVHLPSGRTLVTVYIGATAHAQFSMLTIDYHRLTDKDVDDMVRAAVTIDRAPLDRRRR